MLSEAQLRAVRAFVREQLYRTEPAVCPRYPYVSAPYRWAHTLGVARFAEAIARAEGADPDVCVLAALFHDANFFDPTGYQHHPESGAVLAEQYLTDHGYPPDLVSRVAQAVRDHAGKGREYWLQSPLEVRILVEADLIDKIGVAGAANHLLACGGQGEPAAVALRRLRTDLLERAENSFGIVFTATGARLAQEQLARLRQLVGQWAAELPDEGDL